MTRILTTAYTESFSAAVDPPAKNWAQSDTGLRFRLQLFSTPLVGDCSPYNSQNHNKSAIKSSLRRFRAFQADCIGSTTSPAYPLGSPRGHHRLSISFLANDTHIADPVAIQPNQFARPYRSLPRRSSHRGRPYAASPSNVQRSPDYSESSPRSYRLEIVQHPVKTAEFRESTLTRLPLAPPLIARLLISDESDLGTVDETELPFLVAHLSLFTGDGTESADIAMIPGRQATAQRLLYGNLVSSPHILRNLQGRQGVYFLFPDVSIRWQGQYQIAVTLLKLPRFDLSATVSETASGAAIAQARSLPFDVVSRDAYVAPAQTPLTQYFLQQGARMNHPFARRSSLLSTLLI